MTPGVISEVSLAWQGFLLSLSLCLDLGVVNVAAMRTGVRAGAKASFAIGIGSCFGDLVYATAAVLGVTRLLGSPTVGSVIWAGGTAALVYLSAKALWDAWRAEAWPVADRRGAAGRSVHLYFWQGVVLALASPSAILWFASVGGAVIATETAGSTGGLWMFFAGFFAAGLCWSAIVAIVSARGRQFGAPFVRAFGAVSAIVFACLAAHVFITGYRVFVSP